MLKYYEYLFFDNDAINPNIKKVSKIKPQEN